MLDREGDSRVLEGAWLGAYGAVPKADPEGAKSEIRPINDLRPQNAHIAASSKGGEGTGRARGIGSTVIAVTPARAIWAMRV